MNDKVVRIHVQYQGRRTTVSVHAHLFRLLALYGSHAPDSDNAHLSVRMRCQKIINRLERRGLPGGKLSHLLTAELIDVIASQRVLERYDAWKKDSGQSG